MLVVLALAALAVIAAVVAVSMGRGGELARFVPDVPPLELPEPKRLGAADFMALQLPVSVIGYNTQSVDETLNRVVNALSERDTRIAVLEQQIAELLAGRLQARHDAALTAPPVMREALPGSTDTVRRADPESEEPPAAGETDTDEVVEPGKVQEAQKASEAGEPVETGEANAPGKVQEPDEPQAVREVQEAEEPGEAAAPRKASEPQETGKPAAEEAAKPEEPLETVRSPEESAAGAVEPAESADKDPDEQDEKDKKREKQGVKESR
ncbi:hypothetical protein ABT340_41985 [Streptosporangium sp. NPDC000239]|uniref:hypothetical protein n=1 Tax=Streptosporangium sp. NPDC000239 TaxID=3154248 RepID=UPI003318941A